MSEQHEQQVTTIRGRPPTIYAGVKMELPEYQAVKGRALAEGLTMSAWLRCAIREALQKGEHHVRATD